MSAKKGKYSKQIFLGKDRDGKEIRKRVYADSQKELNERVIEAKAEWLGFLESIPTVADEAEKWLREGKKVKECSSSVQTMYSNLLGHLEKSDLGQVKLPDTKISDIQTFIEQHAEHPETCKKLKMFLNSVFEWAITQGDCKENPTRKLKLPEKQGVSFSEEQISRFHSTNLNELDKMYALTMYHYGLKPTEALALKKEDFNWTKHTLTITRTISYPKNSPVVKPANKRKITISKEAEYDTKRYIESQQDWVFTSDGKLITKSSNTKRWNRLKAEWQNQYQEELGKPWRFSLAYGINYLNKHTLKVGITTLGTETINDILDLYLQG